MPSLSQCSTHLSRWNWAKWAQRVDVELLGLNLVCSCSESQACKCLWIVSMQCKFHWKLLTHISCKHYVHLSCQRTPDILGLVSCFVACWAIPCYCSCTVMSTCSWWFTWPVGGWTFCQQTLMMRGAWWVARRLSGCRTWCNIIIGRYCWNRILWDVILSWNWTFWQGIVLDHCAVKTCANDIILTADW